MPIPGNASRTVISYNLQGITVRRVGMFLRCHGSCLQHVILQRDRLSHCLHRRTRSICCSVRTFFLYRLALLRHSFISCSDAARDVSLSASLPCTLPISLFSFWSLSCNSDCFVRKASRSRSHSAAARFCSLRLRCFCSSSWALSPVFSSLSRCTSAFAAGV